MTNNPIIKKLFQAALSISEKRFKIVLEEAYSCGFDIFSRYEDNNYNNMIIKNDSIFEVLIRNTNYDNLKVLFDFCKSKNIPNRPQYFNMVEYNKTHINNIPKWTHVDRIKTMTNTTEKTLGLFGFIFNLDNISNNVKGINQILSELSHEEIKKELHLLAYDLENYPSLLDNSNISAIFYQHNVLPNIEEIHMIKYYQIFNTLLDLTNLKNITNLYILAEILPILEIKNIDLIKEVKKTFEIIIQSNEGQKTKEAQLNLIKIKKAEEKILLETDIKVPNQKKGFKI